MEVADYSHNEVNSKIGSPDETKIKPPVMHFLAGCVETKAWKIQRAKK